jgi:hypothetical protein
MKTRFLTILSVVLGMNAITEIQAAPVTFQGAATLTLRPNPTNPTLTYDANTFNNELIFIVANSSNASLRITNIFDPLLTPVDKNPTAMVDTPLVISDTNPCKGSVLKPGDVCAFSVLFDTSGVNDGASNQWRIGERLSVAYLTQPFAIRDTVPGNRPLNVTVTVQNPNAAAAVPEPSTLLLAAFGLGLAWVIRRVYEGVRPVLLTKSIGTLY